jgi:pyrimidine deaminase RibD-like protein
METIGYLTFTVVKPTTFEVIHFCSGTLKTIKTAIVLVNAGSKLVLCSHSCLWRVSCVSHISEKKHKNIVMGPEDPEPRTVMQAQAGSKKSVILAL